MALLRSALRFLFSSDSVTMLTARIYPSFYGLKRDEIEGEEERTPEDDLTPQTPTSGLLPVCKYLLSVDSFRERAELGSMYADSETKSQHSAHSARGRMLAEQHYEQHDDSAASHGDSHAHSHGAGEHGHAHAHSQTHGGGREAADSGSRSRSRSGKARLHAHAWLSLLMFTAVGIGARESLHALLAAPSSSSVNFAAR